MKKILTIILLLITILICLYSKSYAVITITEDSFQKSVTKILDPNNTLFKIDRENDTITGLARNFVVKYNFDNNATFTLDFDFNNQMTEQQCVAKYQCISFMVSMFQVVSDYFEIDKNVALSYYVDKTNTQEDVKKLTESIRIGESIDNFTNAVNYAKTIFDKNVSFSDSLFTIESKKLEETAENYKAQVVFVVNLDGDFSQMDTTNESTTDSIISSTQNALDNYKDAQEDENKKLENYINSTNEKEVINNSNKNISKSTLPQTGILNIVEVLLVLSILFSIVFAIKYISYKKIDIKK